MARSSLLRVLLCGLALSGCGGESTRAAPLPIGSGGTGGTGAGGATAGTGGIPVGPSGPTPTCGELEYPPSEAGSPLCENLREDGSVETPIHGALCEPALCPYVDFGVDCSASCNPCSDGYSRWVTACGE